MSENASRIRELLRRERIRKEGMNAPISTPDNTFCYQEWTEERENLVDPMPPQLPENETVF